MDAKRAVQQLERFHYIGQPTHHGRRVEPFRIAGISIDTFWKEHRHPERLPALEAAIDATCRPSTVATQTLTVIEGHDERIVQHIVGAARRQPTAPSSRSQPAPISDQAAPLDVDDRAVAPAPAPPLLGGVTIKRRRRGAPSFDDVAAPDAPTGPDRQPWRPHPRPRPRHGPRRRRRRRSGSLSSPRRSRPTGLGAIRPRALMSTRAGLRRCVARSLGAARRRYWTPSRKTSSGCEHASGAMTDVSRAPLRPTSVGRSRRRGGLSDEVAAAQTR